MRFWLFVLAVGLGELLGIWTAQLLAQEHRIVLRGTVITLGNPEDCQFALDPVGDSESINLGPLAGGFVCDWLKGFDQKPLEVTLGTISQ